MKDIFLLNLRISGIKNIEKPIEIPFYKKTIKDDFNPEKYRIKGIYGENGSGKTAIMTAVKILTRIILDKNYLTDSVNQQLLVENTNKKTGSGFIEVTFYTDRPANMPVGPFIYRYRVDFEVRNDKRFYITHEILENKIGNYTQNVYLNDFETLNGVLVNLDGKDNEAFDFYKNKTLNLLELRSFATYLTDESLNTVPLKRCMKQHLAILQLFASSIYVDIDSEDDHRDAAFRTLQEDIRLNVMRERSLEYMTAYNWSSAFGSDFAGDLIPHSCLPAYKEQTNKLFSFIRIFKTDLQGIDVNTKAHGDFYLCKRTMIYDGFVLDVEFESRGIRKLIHLFNALDAACNGRIVFIDELDSNINDIYLGKLLEYFTYYGKGQLCFTAHNLSPMSVLRESKCAITFISSVNTVHTWTSNGNLNPENAYRMGFIEDSPFNVFPTDFLGVLGGSDE